MKKSISKIIVVIGIAIVVIGIAIVILVSNCFNNFFAEADGIHVFGKFAHIKYQEKCYLIDMKENTVIGDSTFTISGILYDRHKNMFEENQEAHESSVFNGHMEVDAYPVPLTEGYDDHTGVISDETIIFATHKDNEMALHYQVHISRSDPEIVVIYIYLENDEVLVAVCGQNEDEALEKYQQYLENGF